MLTQRVLAVPKAVAFAVALPVCALVFLVALSTDARAGGLPDLTVSRAGPSSVYSSAQFTDTVTVTNRGTAAAKGVVVDYSPARTISSTSAGVHCAGIYRGHSGRGGGITLVGWACSPTLPAGLAVNRSVSFTLTFTAPAIGTVSEAFTVAPSPESPQVNLVSHTAGDTVSVVVPSLPAAPSGVRATGVGDALSVSWTPAAATAAAISSSTVTLTPTGSSSMPVLTGSVGGPATTAVVGPVAPLTTYLITVVNSDASGASPASPAIEYTTPVSSVPPSAPSEVRTWWLFPTEPIGSFLVGWSEAAPGDSPVDDYQILAVPSETEEASTLSNIEPATSRETEFTGNSETPWTITVRAHDAAGWGPWSAPVIRGGL